MCRPRPGPLQIREDGTSSDRVVRSRGCNLFLFTFRRTPAALRASPDEKNTTRGFLQPSPCPWCPPAAPLPSPSRYLAAIGHSSAKISTHSEGSKDPQKSPTTTPPGFLVRMSSKHLGYLLQSEARIAVTRPLQILQIQRCVAGTVPPVPPRYPRPIGVSVFLLGERISSRGHVAGTARWSPFPTLERFPESALRYPRATKFHCRRSHTRARVGLHTPVGDGESKSAPSIPTFQRSGGLRRSSPHAPRLWETGSKKEVGFSQESEARNGIPAHEWSAQKARWS